jgi:hypothetical protein
MSNLGRFGDILGIILLPFIAIFVIAISPLLMMLILVQYIREGNNDKIIR